MTWATVVRVSTPSCTRPSSCWTWWSISPWTLKRKVLVGLEGKDCRVKDGDILLFRFSV